MRMEWNPCALTRQQMEDRRLEGGRRLRRKRWSQTEIANHLGVSRMAVTHWAHQLAAGGMRALYQRSSSGRPAKLSKAQKRTLLRRLKCGAQAAGFPSDRWTLVRIQTWIQREFHIS